MRQELLNARKKAGLTQGQVAERVGINRTIYNKIERGKIKKVPVEVAFCIAKEVKASVNEIFLISNSHEVHKDTA